LIFFASFFFIKKKKEVGQGTYVHYKMMFGQSPEITIVQQSQSFKLNVVEDSS
jgi:hypothetical protein